MRLECGVKQTKKNVQRKLAKACLEEKQKLFANNRVEGHVKN